MFQALNLCVCIADESEIGEFLQFAALAQCVTREKRRLKQMTSRATSQTFLVIFIIHSMVHMSTPQIFALVNSRPNSIATASFTKHVLSLCTISFFLLADDICYREGHYSSEEVEIMNRVKEAGLRQMASNDESRNTINITDLVNQESSNRTVAAGLITKFPAFAACILRESQKLGERMFDPAHSITPTAQ